MKEMLYVSCRTSEQNEEFSNNIEYLKTVEYFFMSGFFTSLLKIHFIFMYKE